MTALPTPLRDEQTRAEGPASWGIPLLTLALKALNQRVLLWSVTLGAGAIWVYAALHPDVLRIVVAALYSGTVLWPFLWRDSRGGSE